MAKKGKEKSTVPAPAAAAPATSKGKKKVKPPAEDDFIIFSNSTDDGKGKRGGASSSNKAGPSAPDPLGEAPVGPPKPTVKQIIGGSSWTGKLPVNLLSEHCQKQKWGRPDYNTVSSRYRDPMICS
jgi:ATP-dependent RNA helicase DHX57